MGGNRLVPTGSLFFNISNFTVMGCSVCLFFFLTSCKSSNRGIDELQRSSLLSDGLWVLSMLT